MLLNNIPERRREGFRKIASINDDIFTKIQDGLSYTSLTSSLETLSNRVAEIKKLDPSDLEEMFSSVGSLSSFVEGEEMIKDVVDDIAFISVDLDLLETKDVEQFKNRLTYFFGNKQIYYAAKAAELKSEYGNSFLLCRIVTD
ncbi:MAG: hypothetical protein ICV53_11620, partial [Flavisolibacter sp.]|nr:hypothetical protein [Flavisolibacter sp.]